MKSLLTPRMAPQVRPGWHCRPGCGCAEAAGLFCGAWLCSLLLSWLPRLPRCSAGTTAAAAAAGGEEASRAEAAAQAARQWEALLHDSWQELQREEEAALRAAGHDADAAEEGEAGDDDADDVSQGARRILAGVCGPGS